MKIIKIKPEETIVDGDGIITLQSKLMEDRISNLHDDDLSHILSRLPTQDVVRTSVLSKQWRYKYVIIYNIHMNIIYNAYKYVHEQHIFPSLDIFMNKMLTRDDSRIISFSLILHDYKPYLDCMRKWIPQILSRNVQKLVLDAYNSFHGVDLSGYHFAGCASLTKLSLSFNCVIQFPVDDCFPNLKSLYLNPYVRKKIEIVNEQLTFPALEVLVMRYCTFVKAKHVEIDVPQLITLKYEHDMDSKDYKIEIRGPKLAEFHYSYYDLDGFVLYAPELQYAVLDPIPYKSSQILASGLSDLLKGILSLKCLKLARQVAQALLKWNDVYAIPTFQQLKRVELCCHPKELFELLQLMPCLEFLSLKMLYRNKDKRVEPLPLFIAPYLKEAEFINFSGGISQIYFIEHFVENARSLERVIVYQAERPRMTEEELKGLLSTLNSMNSSCVIFSETGRAMK